jgi:hypothetical protein
MTREQCLAGAGLVFAQARAERDALVPRAAAEAAWHCGHRLSVDAIEALIIAQRAEAMQANQDQPARTAA